MMPIPRRPIEYDFAIKLLFAVLLLASSCRTGALEPLDLSNVPHDLAMTDAASIDLAQPDLAWQQCISMQCPVGSSVKCASGPISGCCRAGEYCDANGNCRCGTGPGCGVGQQCATGGGPTPPPALSCGEICCGDVDHPCPL